MRPGAAERDREIRIVYQSMRMVLDVLESSCTVRFGDKSKSNTELDCLPNLASCCCYILKGKHISGIRHSLSVRRVRVRCSRTMEDLRLRRCMRSKTMADTCQARIRREKLTSSLAHSGSIITTEGQNKTPRLSTEALREMALSKRPSFI